MKQMKLLFLFVSCFFIGSKIQGSDVFDQDPLKDTMSNVERVKFILNFKYDGFEESGRNLFYKLYDYKYILGKLTWKGLCYTYGGKDVIKESEKISLRHKRWFAHCFGGVEKLKEVYKDDKFFNLEEYFGEAFMNEYRSLTLEQKNFQLLRTSQEQVELIKRRYNNNPWSCLESYGHKFVLENFFQDTIKELYMNNNEPSEVIQSFGYDALCEIFGSEYIKDYCPNYTFYDITDPLKNIINKDKQIECIENSHIEGFEHGYDGFLKHYGPTYILQKCHHDTIKHFYYTKKTDQEKKSFIDALGFKNCVNILGKDAIKDFFDPEDPFKDVFDKQIEIISPRVIFQDDTKKLDEEKIKIIDTIFSSDASAIKKIIDQVGHDPSDIVLDALNTCNILDEKFKSNDDIQEKLYFFLQQKSQFACLAMRCVKNPSGNNIKMLFNGIEKDSWLEHAIISSCFRNYFFNPFGENIATINKFFSKILHPDRHEYKKKNDKGEDVSSSNPYYNVIFKHVKEMLIFDPQHKEYKNAHSIVFFNQRNKFTEDKKINIYDQSILHAVSIYMKYDSEYFSDYYKTIACKKDPYQYEKILSSVSVVCRHLFIPMLRKITQQDDCPLLIEQASKLYRYLSFFEEGFPELNKLMETVKTLKQNIKDSPKISDNIKEIFDHKLSFFSMSPNVFFGDFNSSVETTFEQILNQDGIKTISEFLLSGDKVILGTLQKYFNIENEASIQNQMFDDIEETLDTVLQFSDPFIIKNKERSKNMWDIVNLTFEKIAETFTATISSKVLAFVVQSRKDPQFENVIASNTNTLRKNLDQIYMSICNSSSSFNEHDSLTLQYLYNKEEALYQKKYNNQSFNIKNIKNIIMGGQQ